MKPFYHKTLAVLCSCCVLTASLTGCGNSNPATSSTSSTSSSSTSSTITAKAISVEYSSEDKDNSWNASTATSVTFDGTSVAVSGKGATAKGGTLTITAAGTYVLSGTLTNGQIIVNAGKEDTVRLVLNSAAISCSDSSAINAEQSKKVILTLAAGTENMVSDAKTYTNPDKTTDEPNAAIFSKDDLSINGTGALTVNGNYKNGIVSKDKLVITAGSISVTAVNDALRGHDSVAICGGTFTIDAGADGIQANNDTDTSKGWVSLDGGTFSVTAGNDAIQAETVLQVSIGDFNLKTGGGSANASTKSDADDNRGQGKIPTQQGTSTTTTAAATAATTTVATTAAETASTKGLKAGTGIFITGGTIKVDSCDDTVHSNGSVSITGGELMLSAGSKGIHADSALAVDDGTITISKSYEGLEGATITINGGKINITSSDDGLNASNGTAGSFQNGKPDQNSLTADKSSSSTGSGTSASTSANSCFLRITGGSLTVNASGDGLDSNGDLYIDGGTVLVSGPTDSGNGALDIGEGCTCIITGGILVAAGSSGMLVTPDTASTQNTLAVVYSAAQKAGTLVNVTDSNGASVLTFAPVKDYQSIVISTPKLTQKSTYTVYSGGTSTAKSTDGLYEQGTCSGSTKLTNVTLSSAVTKISDSGTAVTTGGMGTGGKGGHTRGNVPTQSQAAN